MVHQLQGTSLCSYVYSTSSHYSGIVLGNFFRRTTSLWQVITWRTQTPSSYSILLLPHLMVSLIHSITVVCLSWKLVTNLMWILCKWWCAAWSERFSLLWAFTVCCGERRKDTLVAEQTENGNRVLEDIKVLENDISVINPVTRERTWS